MATAEVTRVDLRKELRWLYSPPKDRFTVVDVPPMQFLMIDGSGDPNTAPAYAKAIRTLYALSYALKFMVKRSQGIDYSVMPLEGLWWAPDMKEFTLERKDDWLWTMMIMQPEYVTAPLFDEAREQVQAKNAAPGLADVRLETFREGAAAQIMYLGAYADEGPTIQHLHAFIHDAGHALSGEHHEIYLGDPRRTTPEKLRTVLRQPFIAADPLQHRNETE